MFKKNKRSYSYGYNYSNKRRNTLRLDRVLPVLIGIVLVICIVIAFNFTRIKLAFKGYNLSQQSEILDLTSSNIDIILNDEKLTHIDDWMKLSKKVSNYQNYEKYYALHPNLDKQTVIKTVDEIFSQYVSSLKELGYTEQVIWNMLKTASTSDLAYVVSKQYTYTTVKPFMQVQGYKLQDLDKYIKIYAEKHNYNYAVLYTTYPQIYSYNTSKTTYTILNPEKYTTLVKKGFALPSNYKPKDLVTADSKYTAIKKNKDSASNYQLRKVAYQAFVEMAKAAKQEGYSILINSAFRSYSDQQKVWKQTEGKYGGLYVQQHVSIPGMSEHQTGLGVDITSQSVVDGTRLVFGDTSEYKWVCDNSYKYGYILRFATGTDKKTGISQEPWHFRYVGKKVAKEIYENKWTLEDYVLYKGDLPKLK